MNKHAIPFRVALAAVLSLIVSLWAAPAFADEPADTSSDFQRYYLAYTIPTPDLN